MTVKTKNLIRRDVLRIAGWLAAGVTVQKISAALPGEKFADDVAILNVALGLEHQAIAAYDAGANSKLLSPDQVKIALSFQRDHKRHRDALIKYILRFGGTPVERKSKYDFGAIASATDIVKLAQGLEAGAEAAYLANAYKLQSAEVLNAAVPILADEVRHNTVLQQLLSMDVTAPLKY